MPELELMIMIGLMVAILVPTAAMLVWFERRLLGFFQQRCGPLATLLRSSGGCFSSEYTV